MAEGGKCGGSCYLVTFVLLLGSYCEDCKSCKSCTSSMVQTSFEVVARLDPKGAAVRHVIELIHMHLSVSRLGALD